MFSGSAVGPTDNIKCDLDTTTISTNEYNNYVDVYGFEPILAGEWIYIEIPSVRLSLIDSQAAITFQVLEET